jgi:polyphosphate kinase
MSSPLALPPVDPSDPSLYLNRELSLVALQRRVLAQARDASLPLLERVRFVSIVSNLLDEFFEVRVAGLRQGLGLDVGPRGPDGLEAREVLRRIGEEVHALVDEQYTLLNHELLPALELEGIRILKRVGLSKRLGQWVEDFFTTQILPVLTPLGLDPSHPFPNVQNKGLNFIVSLQGADAFGRLGEIAIVQVPRSLPRLLPVPAHLSTAPHEFLMISSVIHAHIGRLFPGMKVTGCHQFRLTRNSNLWVDEDEVDDLLRALKSELHSRQYGEAVRLEVADNCSAPLRAFLLKHFALTEQDLYQVNGPVNLYRLSALHELVDRPDLKFRPFSPGLPEPIDDKTDLFELIRDHDLLLHHPYQSFRPVVDIVRQAAEDPAVLAIKQTLYRTGPDSPVVDALYEAARNGKEVTAVVELRARFDEAANIRLATRLQSVGANVVYGVVGYKTHAKMLLIVRREGAELRRYVHLGTGNYHTGTSKAYTDFSLLSGRAALGEDIHQLFNQLTGLGTLRPTRHVEHAPFTLLPALVAAIDAEAAAAQAGQPAGIMAKMNALTEPALIAALYRASQAGVPIRLIVRGACRLRPGVPGVSESIEVRSIIGRFLEHSRIYRFHAGGADHVWLGSADWMSRNMHRRVETAFPVLDPALKARVLAEGLDACLTDDANAWLLGPDGAWAPPRGARSGQAALLNALARPTPAPIPPPDR